MKFKVCFPIIVLVAFVWTISEGTEQNGDPVRTMKIQPDFAPPDRSLPSIVAHREVKRPRIGLVLSGGGARGIATIGVIEAFEESGVPIDFIAGTSIGSIIGGLYSAGYSLDGLKALVDTTDWETLLSLGDDSRRRDLFYDQKLAEDKSIIVLRFDGFEPVLPQAFSTGQRLTHYLNILVLQSVYHPASSFDELKIPFRAVATDLISGKRVVLGKGDLTDALRASVTVPLLFNPVRKDTTLLLDGGLTSNIPVEVAREWGADVVVAVDVTSPLRGASELNAPWEIADQVIGIAMQFGNKQQLEMADYVIRPEIGLHSSSDFTQRRFLIAQGKASALRVLAQLKNDRIRSEAPTGRIFQSAGFDYDRTVVPETWNRTFADLQAGVVHESQLRTMVSDLYETGVYENVEVLVHEYADTTVLVLEAHPYPVLRSVEFEGNMLIPSDSLKSAFESQLGKNLNAYDARHSMEEALEGYRRKGYSLARIASVDFDESSGTAVLVIDEGVVSRRTIIGTEKSKDYVIWRELPWDEGEVFQVDLVAEGLNNLYSTNLFEQISIKPRRVGPQNDEHLVIIDVRERYTDLLRLGMTIDNERNVQPSVDLRDENFLGIGSELGLHFFGGLRNRYYLGEFKANRIFDSYLTFNLKTYYDLMDFNVFKDEEINETRWNRVRSGEFREVRQGVSVAFGTQLERLGLVTIEVKTEKQRIWSIFEMPIDTAREYSVGSVKIGTRVDSRDRFPYPRSGVVMEFSYESGLIRTGDPVGFTKMFFSYESYETIFPRQTIRPRIQFGFGDETVPLTEQFRLGGHESFFGYREDNGRGRQLFLLSLQYRYQLPVDLLFRTYVKVRYDLGHIWEKAEQIRMKDLRHGVGFSLGLDTPIGPAEFSIGRAFYIRKDLFDNPLSYGPIVTYFKIGYAF